MLFDFFADFWLFLVGKTIFKVKIKNTKLREFLEQPEAYLRPCQKSKMELLCEICNC